MPTRQRSHCRTFAPRSGLAVFITSAVLVVAGSEHIPLGSTPHGVVMGSNVVAMSSASSVTAAFQGAAVLCHRTDGSKGFVKILIAEAAIADHIAHGDGRVGELLPGNPSMQFGEGCSVIPAPPTGPISFNFVGEVTEVRDPSAILAGTSFSPVVGNAIHGTYTVDPAAIGFPLSPEVTNYAFSPTPPFGMTLAIGATNFEALPGFLAINIANNDPNVGDRYTLFTTPTAPTLPGITWSQIGFELGTTTNLQVFDSTALPLTFPDVALFEQNDFFLSFTSSGGIGFVIGRLSSVTRVP